MMVVVNGDVVKDEDHSTDAAATNSKLEEIHQLDQSNFASSNNKVDSDMTLQTGTNNSNAKADQDSDLYDDVDPVNTANSNGGGTSAQGSLAETYSNMQLGADSDANPKNENDRGKPLSLSDPFGQLVSDTLTDTFDDVDSGENGTGSCAMTEAALQGAALQRAAPAEAVVIAGSQQQSKSECNGGAGEEQASSDPLMQGEVIFRAAENQATVSSHCSQGGDSDHEYEDGELDEEEEEDYDESAASEDFDEDEYRAAQAKHKAKAAVQLPHKKGNSDVLESSIMVIDSEEDEEGEEECDEEEIEDEEEDDEEEEHLEDEESDHIENAQGRTDGEISSQDEYVPEIPKNNKNSLAEQHQSSTCVVSAKNNGDILHNVKPVSLPHLSKSIEQEDKTNSKQSSNKYNTYSGRLPKTGSSNGQSLGQQHLRNSLAADGEYENIARDHSSIMKTVKFSQELNNLKRRAISSGAKQSHESEEDVEEEEWDEDEGWEELEKWNEMRQQEMKYEKVPTELSNKQRQAINWSRQQSQLRQHNSKITAPGQATAAQKLPMPAIVPITINNSSQATKPLTQKPVPKISSALELQPVVPETQSCSVPLVVSLVPQLNEAKGYFEMGRINADDPDLAMHIFSVTIIFARGLSKVIPGAVLRSCREGPHFSYSLLGCVVHTDPIADINSPLFSAEKANARLYTTTSNMSSYLAQHNTLTVTLMIGEIQLAKCSVDLSDLSSYADNKSEVTSSSKKVSGAYELKPVAGNAASEARPNVEALLGLSIELQQSPKALPQGDIKAEPNASHSKNEVTDIDTKENNLSMLSNELASLSKKRERHDSGESSCTNASHSRDSSLALKEARDKLKADLNPPPKKRKITDTGEEKKIYSSDDPMDDKKSKFWEEAEEDLQNWRRAQENVFWKQWLVREKRLQETLSEEWRQRMAGLEDELGQQLEEVQHERASLEDEWRTIRDREARVRRREEQLLELQEDVLQQQAELGAQLRLGSGPSPPQRRAITMARNASSSQLGGASSSNVLEHKQYYKSQWLRGVATTHRKWAADRGAGGGSSSGLLLPSPSTSRRLSGGGPSFGASSAHVSPLRGAESTPRSTSKYDTDIIEEISRLTKERRSLQCASSPPAQQIADIDKTIQQLMEASGL